MAEDDTALVVLEMEGFRVSYDSKKLAENSDYFRAMFSGSFVEHNKKVIVLKDVSPVDMQLILFLISRLDTVKQLTVRQALRCLKISSMFQFHNIQREIEYHLSHPELLDPDTCLFIAQSAEELLIANVAQRASVFSFAEFPQVQHTHSFLELNCEEVQEYLSSDMLNSPKGEIEVFHAATRWLDHNESPHTLEVLACIRYHDLSTDELTDILNSYMLKNCPKISTIVRNIIERRSLTDARDYKFYKDYQYRAGYEDFRNRLDIETVSLEVNGSIKYINSSPRRTTFVPCFAGCVFVKKRGKSHEISKKPKLFAFCFDESRKENKLYPFLLIKENAIGCTIVSKGHHIFTIGDELMLDQGKFFKALHCYDVWREKWIHLSEAPPRSLHSVVLIDDDVYLLCGIGQIGIDLNSFQKYNITSGRWTALKPLPQSAYTVAACAHKGSIVVVNNESSCYQFSYQFSVSTGTWTQLPTKFPVAVGFTSALSYRDFIFLTGFYSLDLYKFRPEPDGEAVLVGQFTYGASNTCLVGSYIYSFTAIDEVVYVERYDILKNEFFVVWSSKQASLPFVLYEFMQLSAFSIVNSLQEVPLD